MVDPDIRPLSDPDAFEAFRRTHEGLVWLHCVRFADDIDEAEDLRQLAWIRIWEARDSFRGEQGGAAWVSRVTVNRCLSAIRRRKRRCEGLADLERVSSHERAIELGQPSIGERSAGGRVELLHGAVEALPQRQREAIRLRYLEGCSAAETARRMGVEKSSVRSLSATPPNSDDYTTPTWLWGSFNESCGI